MTNQSLHHLGKYEILASLGQGGFGEVFKARDRALERIAAQFKHEARLVTRLKHPHIVAVYDVGQNEDRHYIAMQYINSAFLNHQLQRNVAWQALTRPQNRR